MRKVFLLMASVIALTAANAQKGTNQISIGAEANIPVSDFGDGFKTGFGGSVKGLFGIGTAGQITLTSGYSVFKAKGVDLNYSVIPILAGYRQNFSGFYVEPQVGYGIYGSKLKGFGSSSTGAFTWAAGIGYVISGVDLGVRYQSASKDNSSTSFVGIRLAYDISFGGGAE